MRQPFLANPVAFGHPRHGIARNGKLLRLDDVLENYPSTPGDGDTLLFKVSGLPSVPTALADAAGAGQEFRTYALISGNTRILHAAALSTTYVPAWLWRDANGVRWRVQISEPVTNFDLDADTDFDMTLVFTRYGEFGGVAEVVERSQSVAKAVFGEDLETIAGWEIGLDQVACHDIVETRLRLEDASRTGDKACVSWVFLDALTQAQASNFTAGFQYVPAALAEISLEIDPGDNLPNWSIASVMTRADCIPEHTYSGPTVSGCPQGNGAKDWETIGRVVGASYNDSGTLVPITLDIAWTEGYGSSGVQTLTFNNCPPGASSQSVSHSAGASSSASLVLHAGAASITLDASSSYSGSATVTVAPNGTKSGGTGSWSLSATVGGESLGSYSGSLGNSAIQVYNYQTSTISCGGVPEIFRALDTYDTVMNATLEVATPDVQTLCSTAGCIGEWPMGLMVSPLHIQVIPTLGPPEGLMLMRRLSNNLYALLWRRDDTSNWTLHALLGPDGEVTDFRLVEACTVGPGDPDCLTGGIKFTDQVTPFNLGAITLANLRGSYQPETGEAVIATDGVALVYV